VPIATVKDHAVQQAYRVQQAALLDVGSQVDDGDLGRRLSLPFGAVDVAAGQSRRRRSLRGK
jgi:hypothetical protein